MKSVCARGVACHQYPTNSNRHNNNNNNTTAENALMLAKCFAKLGRKEEAREWREKALAMPVNDADDAASHKEAQDLKI